MLRHVLVAAGLIFDSTCCVGGVLTTQVVLSNEGDRRMQSSLELTALHKDGVEVREEGEERGERERVRGGRRGEEREGKRREGQGEFMQATGVLIFL